jgi:hypothetical protein
MAIGIQRVKASCSSSEPHLLTQGPLNDLVRNLNMSDKQAEISGFRLIGWNVLHQNIEICFFHDRQNGFKEFYFKKTNPHFVIIFILL